MAGNEDSAYFQNIQNGSLIVLQGAEVATALWRRRGMRGAKLSVILLRVNSRKMLQGLWFLKEG